MAVTIDNLLAIPDLPDAAALTESDLFHVNQANTDAKASLLALTVWMMDKAHPTGELFFTGVKGMNPNTLFPGQTWVRAAGANRQLRICADDESNFGLLQGSDSVTITAANLPAHTHSFSATTGGSGAFTPAGAIGQGGAHTHAYSGTTSAAGGHTPAGSIASAGAHTHSVTGTAASAGAHQHTFRRGYSWYGDAAVGYALFEGTAASSGLGLGPGGNSTGEHTHSVSGTAASAGAHTHTFTGTAVGNHTHTWSGTTGGISATHNHTFTGTAVAAHTHTVSGTTGSAYAATATAINVSGALVYYGCWRRSA